MPRVKSERAILGVSKNIRHKLFAGFQIIDGFAGAKPGSLRGTVCRLPPFRLRLNPGQETRLDKLNLLIYAGKLPCLPSRRSGKPGTMRLEQYQNASYDDFLRQNSEYWARVWSQSDIAIEGDPDTQQGIRFCIFQMHQTYRGLIDGANIGAKGLTGEDYNGNTFWDTETYCLPFYLFSNPEAAKSLIDFRYKTLPQAMERARQLDCAGACFPVATSDGTESCTLWQHASLQFQSTTAVAYAIWHYVKIIQDFEFLYSTGIQLLIQICRFLASRGQWAPGRNQFGYYSVMGPDEFKMMVNNSCYTNLMAKRTFEYTLKVLADMEKVQPEKKAGLFQTLSCTTGELEKWSHMAACMIIPRDSHTGVFEQHQGFFELPHIDVDSIPVEDFPLYNQLVL
jgi:maltose phosphorylase